MENFDITKYPEYITRISSRSYIRLFIGILARIPIYIKYLIIRLIARGKGATIGNNTMMPLKLALKANENLTIGHDTILETDMLDLRGKISIGSHCIVNKQVQIIRVSHYIDNDDVFSSRYYPELKIDDYVWLATGCKILPNVKAIHKGGIVGAFSVVHSDVSDMEVVSGNPAHVIRKHNTLFDKLIVCGLRGGDLCFHIKTINHKRKI